MDYPFFVREICDVPFDLIEELKGYIETADFIRHDYFGKEQNIMSNHQAQKPSPLMERVIDLVSFQFDRKKYCGADINKLPPGEKIIEHSDIGSMATGVAWNTSHRHKIHFPLQAPIECFTWHRRTQEAPSHSFYMRPGKAYLYNDYALHGFWNKGKETRIHLIISFEDHDWSLKHKMLDQMKLVGTQKYEENFKLST